MALPPSGLAREDVELVHIETKHVTLVIKGKPYHEQYKGLQQYRKLDFHESMEFFVKGEDILEVKIFDIDQQRLVEWSAGHRPIFFENGIYQIIVSPKNDVELTFYHEYPSLRRAVDRVSIGNQYVLMGNLHFQNEVGLSTFEIRMGDKVLLEVTIEIFPTKLNYKEDYQKLLQEVSDEIYNLAFHFIKKTYQRAKAKLDGTPSRSEFFRLMEVHFHDFLQAIRQIERQPHHQLVTTHVKTRGDQLGRLDQQGRNYLRKRPHLFCEVHNGIRIQHRSLMPVSGLKAKKEMTYDTLENRFVKWMMTRLIDKLQDLWEKVQSKNKRYEVEADPDLLTKIMNMIRALEAKTNNSFWRSVGKLDRSIMSLVLQMAPGYRDAYQIFLIVTRGLALQGKLYQMSVKDVATLYEYWTFLKLGQLLGKKYKLVSQDIIQVNRSGLFVNLEKNRSAKRVYEHPHTGEKIILTYQKYEGRLPTIPQIPDTMLSIEKKGKDYTFNYIFDAKYRIDFAVEGSSYQKRYHIPGPMEEDINTMHRYRDSLVVRHNGPYERTAFGAYVLFPWYDEDSYQEHKLYKSINEVNIGGLPFLPNATRLVEQLIERLIEKSPEELQKEGILPQGIMEEWRSSFDEKVLVGMVPSARNYHAHLRHRFYHIPVKRLKKGWQEAKYIALYPKQGAAPVNGVTCFGKITDVKFVKRYEINELPKNSSEEYVRFEIESWHFLKDIIRPVGYGISVYTMTTLNTLKEAKELPELFMKSKEEIALWRMLRRLSDRIRFDLDDRYLDKASKIKAYRIKDIVIQLEDQQLAITRGTERKTLPVEALLKQPSMVFKEMVRLMDRDNT
ncbi:restriction endonuclease-like protein [Ureibacillus sp. FSL K6-8385]|uniref:restriction endonuclease-like protein n=1 Tax=Ureibacillus sp. FSL K6-8385 TaxID=2954684 RepID=UPI0031596270